MSSKVVNLQLTSLDGVESLNITNVYVIDEIPLTTSCPEITKFPHLAGVQFIAGGQKVHLLLGQDNAEALVPFEIRQGQAGEPFATRTLFGWALNGPSGPGSTCGRVVSHFITSKSVKDDIQKLWEIESDNHNDLAMSIEDKLVEDLWDHEVKLIDGHYQLPIPWKKGVSLPSNIGVAMVRLWVSLVLWVCHWTHTRMVVGSIPGPGMGELSRSPLNHCFTPPRCKWEGRL